MSRASPAPAPTGSGSDAGDDVGGVLLSLREAANNEAVARALDRVRDAVAERMLDAARVGDLVIVLGEMLNNTVEHALADRDDGWFEIVLRDGGERLEVEVADDGRALPPALLSGGSLPEMGEAVDDLPESGFGWFIIHSLVDDMTYAREGGVNHLSFSI